MMTAWRSEPRNGYHEEGQNENPDTMVFGDRADLLPE